MLCVQKMFTNLIFNIFNLQYKKYDFNLYDLVTASNIATIQSVLEGITLNNLLSVEKFYIGASLVKKNYGNFYGPKYYY